MIEIKTTKDIVKEFVEFNEGGLGFVCCSRAWDKWVSLESIPFNVRLHLYSLRDEEREEDGDIHEFG